ncbi:MAG: DUF4390 domain-containing protein [Acidobacteriota bacterium]
MVALICLATAPSGAADEASISYLTVEVDGNRAILDFHLANAFDERFLERLRSGLPTGFVYQMELLKDRKRWYDRPLRRNSLQVVAMYDAVSREYLVNTKLDGKLVESRMVKELEDLEDEMTKVFDLPAFALDNLPRSWRLLVRVRAELGSKTILSIIPSTIHTDWRESRKFRTKNVLADGA